MGREDGTVSVWNYGGEAGVHIPLNPHEGSAVQSMCWALCQQEDSNLEDTLAISLLVTGGADGVIRATRIE